MSETVDKRGADDRRQFTWRTVFFGFLRSRRRDVRRDSEGEVLFLDWHHPWLFVLSVGTMLLSGVDGFLTLELLQRGMVEANPLMAGVLGWGTESFAVAKMALTAIGILMLVYLAKARFLDRIRVGIFLTVLFSVYCCLVCYEIVSLLKLL